MEAHKKEVDNSYLAVYNAVKDHPTLEGIKMLVKATIIKRKLDAIWAEEGSNEENMKKVENMITILSKDVDSAEGKQNIVHVAGLIAEDEDNTQK